MKIYERKRIKRSYSPTGPITRAALDFLSKRGMCYDFECEFHTLPADEQQRKVIEMFADRQATEASFSFLLPEPEPDCGRQIFTIKFARAGDCRSPRVEIEIKSFAQLREQAKLYPRDASAYSDIRKVKSKARAIDKAL